MKKYHFESIDSTSSYLKEHYHRYENETFISASFQTRGHGRYNREWVSLKGENLLFSILIKDSKIIDKFDNLSLASAVCVYRLLKELNIENVSIKWPNDVYVNDNKISGILLESVSFSNKIEALIIGVGLNVNSKEWGLIRATSIYRETNLVHDLEILKENLYSKFLNMLNYIKNDEKSYLDIVRNNNYLLNKSVSVNGKIVKVIGVDDDNSLIVNDGDRRYNLYSGEVILNKEDI